jgi:hypothetical protein
MPLDAQALASASPRSVVRSAAWRVDQRGHGSTRWRERTEASGRRRGHAAPAVRHTRSSRGAAAATRRKHRREQAPHGPCSPAQGGAAQELGRARQDARGAARRDARCFDRLAHRAGQPPLVQSGAGGGRGARGQVVTRAPRDGRYRSLQACQRYPRARHIGDEVSSFGLVLPEARAHYAAGIGNRLCELLASRPLVVRGHPEVIERITLSIGVAGWRAGESSAEWYARVDGALYEASAAAAAGSALLACSSLSFNFAAPNVNSSLVPICHSSMM